MPLRWRDGAPQPRYTGASALSLIVPRSGGFFEVKWTSRDLLYAATSSPRYRWQQPRFRRNLRLDQPPKRRPSNLTLLQPPQSPLPEFLWLHIRKPTYQPGWLHDRLDQTARKTSDLTS